MFGYLGTEGYLINVELRKGSQHCQKNTPAFIQEILKLTRQITQEPLLMRLDSGNDSQDNFEIIKNTKVLMSWLSAIYVKNLWMAGLSWLRILKTLN
ncbi:hypothetical protein EYB58_10285 [Desulfobacter hydrogenophilus]|uniref:Transposase DDE domain-containing protein n=1 Tax=Desulfobacter hydrogenophilus TaxID=2291 RepID=A0ABX5RFM8_9BACT|nr:hypothetical protein [Desulfobacter hydrogenophilus]QBH13274.1 hypothetical protein EYB58_10285 [Desulfobacter hydrogenophilus]